MHSNEDVSCNHACRPPPSSHLGENKRAGVFPPSSILCAPPPPRSRMALHIISLLLFLLNPTSSLRTPLPMFMTHPPVFSHQVNLEILYRRYWKQKELKQSNCEVCSCLPCVPDFSTKVSTHTVSLYLSVLPQWNRLLLSFREESGSTRGQADGQGRLWRP